MSISRGQAKAISELDLAGSRIIRGTRAGTDLRRRAIDRMAVARAEYRNSNFALAAGIARLIAR